MTIRYVLSRWNGELGHWMCVDTDGCGLYNTQEELLTAIDSAFCNVLNELCPSPQSKLPKLHDALDIMWGESSDNPYCLSLDLRPLEDPVLPEDLKILYDRILATCCRCYGEFEATRKATKNG